jgi:hypothetical protein
VRLCCRSSKPNCLHGGTLCRLHGCAPVVVAAGHYPLSVVVHPDTARYDRLPTQTGAHNHLPTRHEGSRRRVLSKQSVTSSVSHPE